ncbi:putative lipo domain protein, partial [Clostridioides difficile CD21]
INNIIKNVIQEEDNSIWIEEVEIYYNGKLIELR